LNITQSLKIPTFIDSAIAGSFGDTFYLIGSARCPATYPDMGRTFQSIVCRETKARLAERGVTPEVLVACVGGKTQKSRNASSCQ